MAGVGLREDLHPIRDAELRRDFFQEGANPLRNRGGLALLALPHREHDRGALPVLGIGMELQVIQLVATQLRLAGKEMLERVRHVRAVLEQQRDLEDPLDLSSVYPELAAR